VAFPKRNVEQITLRNLPADTPEIQFASLLSQYQEVREQRLAGEPKRVQAASGLLLCHLQQRLFSSVEAFARTLKVHRRTVEKQRQAAGVKSGTANLDLLRGGVGADDDRATLGEAELAAETEAQVEAATGAAQAPVEHSDEDRLLQQMTDLAESGRRSPDARIRYLCEWISSTMCPGGQWNRTRIIIFTEHEDTLRYLEQQLRAAIAATDRALDRLAIYRGSTPNDEREEIKRAFNADPDEHPVRILIATDAAREGLNLQAHCNRLYHFDIPWNPGRTEQRNGRIDRKLHESQAGPVPSERRRPRGYA